MKVEMVVEEPRKDMVSNLWRVVVRAKDEAEAREIVAREMPDAVILTVKERGEPKQLNLF